uniref:C-type lectin domain-containing protein n=1 Tax=Capra hircus TaxID=9925 RepID=A0A8C2QR37_CAPHI
KHNSDREVENVAGKLYLGRKCGRGGICSSYNNWKTLQGKHTVSLISGSLLGRGHLSWTWTFCERVGSRGGKDLQEKCLAIISPVTPAKLCSCILIIFILVALNVVTLSALVAARSRKPDLKVLYVTCPEGWIGFGSKCFYFSEESKNWTFSQTSCTKMEAVLAQFEMEEELVRNIFGSCS